MRLRQQLNILGVLVTLVVNGLAVGLPLNGRDTGSISDSFKVLFVPAGWVFSIWGLIYLGLIGFAIYQALPSQRDNPRLVAISGWFLASCFFNSAWLFAWHYGIYPLSLLLMLGLLVSLLMIYLRLDIGRIRGSGRNSAPPGQRWLVNLTFSIYLGWISVATIANFSDVLWDLGFNGGSLGPVAWTLALLAIATGLGLAMIALRREVAYPLVLVWAFLGIMAKQSAEPAVSTAAGVTAAILVVALVVQIGARWLTPTMRRGNVPG